MGKVMKALAAAYRLSNEPSGNVASEYLPSPKVQRPTWAWDVQDLPINGVKPPAEGTPKTAEDRAQVLHSQVFPELLCLLLSRVQAAPMLRNNCVVLLYVGQNDLMSTNFVGIGNPGIKNKE